MTTDTTQHPAPSALPTFFHQEPDHFAGMTFFHHHSTQPAPYHISLLDLDTYFPQDDMGSLANGMQLLSAKEKVIYHKMKHPRRKRHWLGGRLALKHALLSLFQPNTPLTETGFTGLSILPAPSGRPTVSSPLGHQQPSVSISHSGRYGIGMAALTQTCGIDIQQTSPRIRKVKERLMSGEEWSLLESSLPDLDELQLLTILWAAKEAVKKGMLYDQPLIFTGITLQRVISNNHPLQLSFSCANPRHPGALVHSMDMDEYQLAFTSGDLKSA